jgi:3'-5' exoribonuclease 1
MIYIIVDLEATCWEAKDQTPNEIIEIGAVCINDKNELIGEFDVMIRPMIHPILSDFCTKLTSITQADVQNAPLFPEGVKQFQDWIAHFGEPYCLCSWGFYDKKQLRLDCEWHGLDSSWVKNHISLKHQLPKVMGKPFARLLGMQGALEQEKLKFEGTHHRGIDDAKNIAKIFMKYFGKWKFR